MFREATLFYYIAAEKQVQEIGEVNVATSNVLSDYADSVVKWFVAFTSKIKRLVRTPYGEPQDPRGAPQSTDSLSIGPSESQTPATTEQNRGSTSGEELIAAGNVIRDVIYSTRQNVHIVHEVFRQVLKVLTFEKHKKVEYA